MKRAPSSGVSSGEVSRQLDNTAYDNVKVVALAITDVALVADNIDDLIAASGNIAEILIVAGLEDEIISLVTDKATLDSLFADKATLDSLVADKDSLDAVALALAEIIINASNIDDIVTIADSIADVNTIADDIAAVITVAVNIADITNFSDVYYGAKVADPTLRNDGSAMVSGDMYFNTIASELRYYKGTVWEPIPTLTKEEVKSLYESNDNTNVYNDIEKAKVTHISVTQAVDLDAIELRIEGLDNVDNTSDANKPVSDATQTALDLKAPIADPTFTGTVSGISKTMVGLSNVDNTSDTAKPISTDTQTALDLKTNNVDLVTVVGNINNPLLSIPLHNSLDIEAGNGNVSFSRGTIATYVDRYGILKYATTNEPRFEDTGLLVEGDSTNVLLNSEIAVIQSGTVDANVIASPDGNVTADKVIPDDGNTVARWAKYFNKTSGSIYTVSSFNKAGEMNRIKLGFYESGDKFAHFDLSDGTIVSEDSGIVGKIEALDGGWYRCSATFTAGATSTTDNAYVTRQDNADADGTKGWYTWGGQIEELLFASSYIPTIDSEVTRSKDDCYVSLANNTIAGSAPSTTVVDFDRLGLMVGAQAYIYSSSVTPSLAMWFWAGHNSYAREGIDTNIDFYNNYSLGKSRACVVNDLSETVLYNNGIEVGRSALGDNAPVNVLTSINIGSNQSLDDNLFGHIKNFRMYDKALMPSEALIV